MKVADDRGSLIEDTTTEREIFTHILLDDLDSVSEDLRIHSVRAMEF